MPKRNYRQISGTRTTRVFKKRPRRYQGLVPSYRGFQPRAFSRGEWKYLDNNFNLAVSTGTSSWLLNGLAPGSSASQRIGQKVSVRSLEIRLYNQVTAGTGVDQLHRQLVVMDRQANGAPPAIANILSAADVAAPRNLEYRKRFKVLLDKTFTLNATAEPGSQKWRKYYIKFKRPIVVEFNAGVAGTIADIVTNSLYIFNIGSQAAGATAGTVTGYIRMRYTDM